MYKEAELKEEELTKEQEELQKIMQDNKEYIDVKRCN